MTKAAAGLVPCLATLATACFQPRPIDARAMLAEMRRAEAAQAAQVAGPTAPAGVALDEDRAVAAALVSNRALRALRLERGVAEGEIVAAGAVANPVLRLEVTHVQERDPRLLGGRVGLAWAPPQPVVRGARIAGARAHREEIEGEIAEREWMLASDIRATYAELGALDEEIALAAAAGVVRGRLRHVVEDQLHSGGATRFDLDLATLAEADAERLRGEKVIERRQTQARLAGMLGLPPGAALIAAAAPPSVIAGTGEAGAAGACTAGLDERALEARPALVAAAARYRAAEQLLRQEMAARWPWFSLSAFPRLTRNQIDQPGTDVLVGIDLTLPLFNLNGGPVRAAEAARDRASAEWVATLDGVRRDIALACGDRVDQAALLRLQRERLTPVLEQHDRLMEQALGAHQVEMNALIVTEERVLQDRLLLVRTRLRMRLASIALERAVGARLDRPPAR